MEHSKNGTYCRAKQNEDRSKLETNRQHGTTATEELEFLRKEHPHCDPQAVPATMLRTYELIFRIFRSTKMTKTQEQRC